MESKKLGMTAEHSDYERPERTVKIAAAARKKGPGDPRHPQSDAGPPGVSVWPDPPGHREPAGSGVLSGFPAVYLHRARGSRVIFMVATGNPS